MILRCIATGRAAWPPQHPDQFCGDDFGPVAIGAVSLMLKEMKTMKTLELVRHARGARDHERTHKSRLTLGRRVRRYSYGRPATS